MPPAETPAPILPDLTPKSCDLCGESERLRALGHRVVDVLQRRSIFRWEHHDTVCEGCGLAFAARIPSSEFLAGYYSQAHTLYSEAEDIAPGFDVEARLATLRRHQAGRRILEVGAGRGAFCHALAAAGFEARGLDPVEATDGTLVASPREATERAAPADAVVAYHVLEHIPHPLAWLRSLREHLVPGGLLVLEVPDATRWPLDAWHHEHLLQLTPEHLGALAEAAGFETLGIGEEAPSRPHGVVYVGRLGAEPDTPPTRLTELQENATQWVAGAARAYGSLEDVVARQRALAAEVAAEALAAARVSDRDATGEIVCWGANEIASAIGQVLTPDAPWPVRLVDKADSKIGASFPGFAGAVDRPTFAAGDPTPRVFVLCTRNFNAEIAAEIEALDLPAARILEVDSWPHR